MDGTVSGTPLPHQGPGRDERIEELVDTLECPVCLDTADTAPIYQCPEGHLICEVGQADEEVHTPDMSRTVTPRWLSAPSVGTA